MEIVIDEILKIARENKLYFGYGSNLNQEDYSRHWAYRKPLKAVGTALAKDACPVFDKYAETRHGGVLSLKAKPGAMTPGVLFEVDDIDWGTLKKKEGGYSIVPIVVQYECPQTWSVYELIARTYVTSNPEGFQKPSDDYLQVVRDGFKAFGLSYDPVRLAAKRMDSGFTLQNQNFFTNGTLCRGEMREYVMQRKGLIQVAMADFYQGQLWECGSGAYPGLVVDPSVPQQKPVKGDLWSYESNQVSRLIQDLDAIEGHIQPGLDELRNLVQRKIVTGSSPEQACTEVQSHLERAIEGSLYRRHLVTVDFDGRPRYAWTYFYNKSIEGLKPVTQNNWRLHKGRWESTIRKIFVDHSAEHGGFEAMKAKLLRKWKLASVNEANCVEDLVQLLITGQIEERDVAMALWSEKSADR